MVHDNVQCPHGKNASLGQLRKLFMAGDYTGVLSAITDIDPDQFNEIERIAVAAMLRLANATPSNFTGREMTDLVERAKTTDDLNIWAEVLAAQLRLSHRLGHPSTTQQLATNFFADLPRTPVTMTHWAIVCGQIAFTTLGPDVALQVFRLGEPSQLKSVSPCLHESLWRCIAAAWARKNELDAALVALETGGLPENRRRDLYHRAQDGTVVSYEVMLYRL